MIKTTFLLLLMFTLIVGQASDTDPADTTHKSIRRLSAARLMAGKVIFEETENLYFMNMHVRNTAYSERRTLFTYYLEYGANIPLLIPYVKIGPEIRIANMFYSSGHAGMATVFLGEPIDPFVFYGLCLGMSVKISKTLALEFEMGQNHVLMGNMEDFSVPYLTIGFSALTNSKRKK